VPASRAIKIGVVVIAKVDISMGIVGFILIISNIRTAITDLIGLTKRERAGSMVATALQANSIDTPTIAEKGTGTVINLIIYMF
jgi:hypothetical protein